MSAYAMKQSVSAGACTETPVSFSYASAPSVVLSDIALRVVSVFVLAGIQLSVLINGGILDRIVLPILLALAALPWQVQTLRDTAPV